MGKFNSRTSSLVLGLTAALAAPSLLADNSGITITPMIGVIDYDTDREYGGADDYENGAFGAIGLGYRLDNPFQFEVVYATEETENSANVDVDYESLRFDVLYHFGGDRQVNPYFAIGLGHTEFEPSNGSESEETTQNIGLGFKGDLADWVSVRSDFRVFRDYRHEHVDFAFTLGLQFNLGGNSGSEPVVVADTRVPGDTDGDGVNDDVDQCPGTEAGVQVDTNGCALDDDSDGVPNHKDECPNSEAGAKVDSKGCYIILSEQVEINLEVNFANNSSVVDSKYNAEVQRVADFLRSYPETNVTVEGHTDSNGSAAYNKSLSDKRANAIANKLVSDFGVAADRVTAVGYGEERPVASNDTSSGRAENRRVVAVVETTVEKRAE